MDRHAYFLLGFSCGAFAMALGLTVVAWVEGRP